jgi:bifunctional DNase/RNase
MVQMFINKVALDPVGRALLFLTDENNDKVLPIWIGIAEAQAIVTKMQDRKYPRPMTHDLLQSVIEQAGYVVQRVRVTRLEDSTFYAVLDLEGPLGELEIDSRPSDAIALALRVGAPIYVAEEVLEQAEPVPEEADEEEMETFRRLMSTMPSDTEPSGPDLPGPAGEGGPVSEEV